MNRRTLFLRVGILASVAWALTDPRPWGGSQPPPALEARDLSASMGPAQLQAPAGGADEWLAVADGWRWLPLGSPPPVLARGASALGAALHDAARRHPGRDVVLATDGRATDDALAGSRAVRAAGGRLFVRLPVRPAADVGLGEARAARSGTGGAVAIDVRLSASTAGRVRLSLAREGRNVAAEEVAVAAGAAPLVRLLDPAPPEGLQTYRLRLAPLAGTPNDDPGNDELEVGVRPVRQAVLVWGEAFGGLPTTPEGPWVDVSLRPTPGAVDAADVVILMGEPWSRLGVEAVETLSRFVAGGGRLLVLGGPEAYGPGGWGGTAFERALLPLVVRTPPGSEVDWVVALDVSGSTHGEPLRALVAAAKEALRAAQPGERLGILPFTGRAASGLLPPGSVAAGDAAGAKALEVSLDALAGGGETDLIAGVGSALEVLAAGPTSGQRRLLLLTDGDPDRKPSAEAWRALGARLEAARVRFGALVYGGVALLEVLRLPGVADRESTLQLAGTSGLTFHLLRAMARQRATAERERLGGPDGVEAALGTWADLLPREWRPAWVHDVEPHAEARPVARARWSEGPVRGAAFAAERTVGAGVVHALAWGPASEPERERAWQPLVPIVERLLSDADRGLAADFDDEGRLTVRVPEALGTGRLWLVAADRVVEALEIAPALFRSVGAAPDVEGLRVRGGEGSKLRERTLRLPVRPPPEHRGSGLETGRLRALAEAGGGRVLAPAEAPPQPLPAPGPALAPWLLLTACILLVLDRARA